MDRSKYMELKKKAVRYYNENQVPQQLEGLLNSMFLEDPPDLYGYMSTYFGKLSKPPIISSIVCHPSMNMRGHECVNASVSCCIKGETKHVLDISSLFDNSPQKEEVTARMKSASEKATSKATKKKMKEMSSMDNMSRESLPEKPKKVVTFALLRDLFEQEFVPVLMNPESMDQQQLDGMLQALVEEIAARGIPAAPSDTTIPPAASTGEASIAEANEVDGSANGSVPQIAAPVLVQNPSTQTVGSTCEETVKACIEIDASELYPSALFSSLLVAATTSHVNEESLCKTLIRTLKASEAPSGLPTPALSVLTCNPASPGKLMMIKDVLLCPKATTPIPDVVKSLMKLSACLGQTLQTKFGPAGLVRNSDGRYTPPIDKIDQLFELLSDAAAAAGATIDECFDIIIDVNASQLYDEEKSKYEIALAGGAKSTEALIEMYRDWVENHPVVAIIDGVSKKDTEGMTALFGEFSTKCAIIISDTDQDRVAEFLAPPGMASGVVVQPEKTVASLTQLFAYGSTIASSNASILMTDGWCTLQNGTTVVDLAVAMGASFLLIGPACGYQSLSRLLQLHMEGFGDEWMSRGLKEVEIELEESESAQLGADIGSGDTEPNEIAVDR